MKWITRPLRQRSQRTQGRIREWLQPKFGALGHRLRLPARIRLANRRAARHPRRTSAVVVSLLLFALGANVAQDAWRGNTPDEPAMSRIAAIGPMLDGFRAIQAGKSVQRRTLQDLTDRGVAVKRELDSLIRLPRKTGADSLAIVRRYGQLERIVKSLKQSSPQ